jgi:hypothetical protein
MITKFVPLKSKHHQLSRWLLLPQHFSLQKFPRQYFSSEESNLKNMRKKYKLMPWNVYIPSEPLVIEGDKLLIYQGNQNKKIKKLFWLSLISMSIMSSVWLFKYSLRWFFRCVVAPATLLVKFGKWSLTSALLFASIGGKSTINA